MRMSRLGRASTVSGRKPPGTYGPRSVSKLSPQSQLRQQYQRAAYHRGIVLLVEAHDILGGVKTTNWTQAVVLNAVFNKLEEATESLAEISPNDLAQPLREAISGWTASSRATLGFR